METVRIFVGFDQREAAAYHVFCQSVIEKSSLPVEFHPITKGMFSGGEGSNSFTLSRYLVPHLCDFNGWALFLDGDMVCDVDIAELWGWRNTLSYKAVSVVKHDYKTRHHRKYVGSKLATDNEDYPRKNWSSVVLWNCSHFANRVLTPEFVSAATPSTPSYLHRFEWLQDKDIGELSPDWNYLVVESSPASPHLYHYTLGVPGLTHYADDYGSWKWHRALMNALECAGEAPVAMVQRSMERSGAIP
jgi:lipopolysaccharide biosynthesis glycosyltransferase